MATSGFFVFILIAFIRKLEWVLDFAFDVFLLMKKFGKENMNFGFSAPGKFLHLE